MLKFITAFFVLLTLAACSTPDPYRDPPKDCAAIEKERQGEVDRITTVGRLRAGKLAVVYGLAVCVVTGYCAPLVAAVPPILEGINIDTSDSKDRAMLLAVAKVARNCP